MIRIWYEFVSFRCSKKFNCHAVLENLIVPKNVGTAFEPCSSGIQIQHWIIRAKGLTHKPDLVGMPYTVNRFNSNPFFTISYNILIAIDFFSPCKKYWLIKVHVYAFKRFKNLLIVLFMLGFSLTNGQSRI